MRQSPVVTMVFLGILAAIACTPASGAAPDSSEAQAATDAPTTAAPCPITRPEPAFRAPAPFPTEPPARYESDWYGSQDLWTMLAFDGEVWPAGALPHSAQGLGQKTFWWSANWKPQEEPEPRITMVGRRLDGPGTFDAGKSGTNASADFGTAMLVGVEVPTAGCWQLTGRYRDVELSYVVLIRD